MLCTFLSVIIFAMSTACIVPLACCRGFAARSTPAEEAEIKPAAQEKPLQEPKSGEQSGWFSRFYRENAIDTGHEQHSSRLSDKDTVYELQCNYWTFHLSNFMYSVLLLCIIYGIMVPFVCLSTFGHL